MTRSFSGNPAWLILAVLGISCACASAAAVQLSIEPTWESQPLLLDSLRYQNAADETLSVTRLSYLLSGFALERTDGSWVQLPDQYAWLDASGHRNGFTLEGVAKGTYKTLRFFVGPDPAANGSDPAKRPADHPLNANLNGLHWDWRSGYIFLAAEGHYRTGNGEIKGWSYHFARDPNRTAVSLPLPEGCTDDAALAIQLDVKMILAGLRSLSFTKDGATTHSSDGDAVASALAANLSGAFQVVQLLSTKPAISRPPPVQPLYLPEKYTPYRFTMSSTFPIPALPRDNPLIEERIALGKALFNDSVLSVDHTIACGSCHQEATAFADPKPFSQGVRRQTGTRHSMPLFNLAWKSSFFWDGRAGTLREQALMPIQDHTEMDHNLPDLVAGLASNSAYPPLFEKAFGSPEITPEKLGLALEQYLLTLTSYDSKFDRAMKGRATLTQEEQRGFELFSTEYEPRTGRLGADCFHCHGGALFTDHQFHNNGLEPLSKDHGRFSVTSQEADLNKFSTPSLRNVGTTGPYMHDGRFGTLEEVIAHYSGGIHRSPTLDPNLAKHPAGGLPLDAASQQALVAFLKTLTSEIHQP